MSVEVTVDDILVTGASTAARMAIIPVSRRLIWDMEQPALYVGDGVTVGGVPATGQGGGITDLSFLSTAHGSISGETVAAIDANGVHNPDLSDPVDVLKIIGITANAAADGASVTVITLGTFTEIGWNWNPGPIYCAASGGALTQTVPATGALVQVAVAISPTTIQVGIEPAIFL